MFKKLIVSPAFRRRVSWIIAAVLILPFLLFFSSSNFSTGRRGQSAGTLFGKAVPLSAFEDLQQGLRRQWADRYPGLPPDFLESMLTRSVWDRLTLLAEGKRQRLPISDLDIAARIQRVPDFQDNGRFSHARYELILRGAGSSPQRFEQSMRDDLLIEQLLDRVKAAVSVSDEEVRAAYEQAHEQLAASVVFFDPSDFVEAADAAITEEEVRARYDAHPDEVRVPAQVVFDYAGVSFEELAAKTQPTAEESGLTEEERDASKTERVGKQLKTLALDLQEDLEDHKPFEDIVTSRALVRRSAGPLDPEAEPPSDGPNPVILRAVKDVPEGQLSDVIDSGNRVDLARVTRRIPVTTPPFEAVRSQVRHRLILERSRTLAKAAAESWRTHVTEQQAQGLRFEEVAAVDGRPVVSARFTRTQAIDPLGYQGDVNARAFATAPGQVTDVLETPRGFALLRPEERIPADRAGFDQEAPRIREETLTAKQSEQVEQWMSDLRTRAHLKSFLDEQPDAKPEKS